MDNNTDHRFMIMKDNKYGYIDIAGNEVIPPQYEAARIFTEGLGAVRLGGKWFFIDPSGKPVFDNKTFTGVTPFSEGLAGVVDSTRKYGYINKEGNVVIEHQYTNAHEFSEGIAAVYMGQNRVLFIDKTGQVKFEKENPNHETYRRDFSEGLIPFYRKYKEEPLPTDEVIEFYKARDRDDKYGFLDTTGKFVIEPVYDGVDRFSEGLAAFLTKSKGIWESVPGHSDHEAWAYNYGYLNHEGEVVIKNTFDGGAPFSEGLAAVSVESDGEEKNGYINKNGDVVIPLEFEGAAGFSEGLADVRKGSKWGYINKEGEMIIEPKYNRTERFTNGLAYVEVGVIYDDPYEMEEEYEMPKEEKSIEYGYINRKGEYVWKASGSGFQAY